MRSIDLRTWPRREHFQLYSSFDHPHFGLCANVDLTAFYREAEESELLKMTLSVQGHHALMDGVHAGRFYVKVQNSLRDPVSILGEA
jgi:chloramphenicol O-acetyltransferase type A